MDAVTTFKWDNMLMQLLITYRLQRYLPSIHKYSLFNTNHFDYTFIADFIPTVLFQIVHLFADCIGLFYVDIIVYVYGWCLAQFT